MPASLPPAEWSPLVPPSSAVCLQGNRQGERAASTWLTNNWDQRLCSEGVVAASSEREGAWLDLSTAACWRGPGAPTPWPGVELPTAWSSVSAGNGWLSLPQPERPSRTLPPRLAKTPGCTEIAWKNLPLISKSERQTRAGEGAWTALIRSGLPRAWPSCLEKPGAGRCGKWLFGFAAELLNLLDSLALPQSLPTRTRQLFRRGRGIQGKQT